MRGAFNQHVAPNASSGQTNGMRKDLVTSHNAEGPLSRRSAPLLRKFNIGPLLRKFNIGPEQRKIYIEKNLENSEKLCYT